MVGWEALVGLVEAWAHRLGGPGWGGRLRSAGEWWVGVVLVGAGQDGARSSDVSHSLRPLPLRALPCCCWLARAGLQCRLTVRLALRSASFVDMTGAEESTARNVLEASNWDLNDAITLHFASQEAGGGGGFGAAAAPPAAAAGGAGDWGASGGVSDDGIDDATRAAIAAAQAEMAVDSPEVRKADEHIEDQLFDPAQVRAMQRMETAQLKKNAVADPFRDLSSGEASKGGLGDMFKTPDALTFKGGLEEAREAAEKSGKLLMVNIDGEHSGRARICLAHAGPSARACPVLHSVPASVHLWPCSVATMDTL